MVFIFTQLFLQASDINFRQYVQQRAVLKACDLHPMGFDTSSTAYQGEWIYKGERTQQAKDVFDEGTICGALSQFMYPVNFV